jgi:hypothetical protein
VAREELVDLFVALIKDSEGEVKIMTIGQALGTLSGAGTFIWFGLI